MPRSCVAKEALCRGLRPNAQTTIRRVCSRSCIFCDIWRLAAVVTTHVPLSTRYSASFAYRMQQQNPDFARMEKTIQAQLQTQRSRINSIMSISTVEGAEESGGLQRAYDNCFESVEKLLFQEELLEENLIRPPPGASRRASRDAGCGSNVAYYTGERRSSRVGIAI